MKRFLKPCLSFLLIILLSFCPGLRLLGAEKPSELYAQAAVLMDGKNQRILFGKEENKQLPMASTTKIMTCLYALEHGNLSDLVTFSARAAKAPKVHLGASRGDRFLLSDLLYSLMLESHNDTAIAIAEHLEGSVEAFCEEMTREARNLGCYDTCFKTPNGLDAEGHYTTCRDLAVITSRALQNQDFRKIIKESDYTIQEADSHQAYELHNKNAFLSSYPGAVGVKTGYTGGAGYCFVGAVEKEDRLLISVVLGSGSYPNRSYKWKDTAKLMDYGTENYEMTTVDLKKDSITQIPVEQGQTAYCRVRWPDQDQLLTGTLEKVTVTSFCLKKLTAPVYKNQLIGNVKVQIDGKEYRSYPIYTAETCKEATFGYYLGKLFSAFMTPGVFTH